MIGIALSRGEEDFGDAEVSLLALARPHLIQAYRNAELATARAATLRALETGLQTIGSHVVVLDRHGRVEFATDRARELLARPGSGREALPPAIREWLAHRRQRRSASEPLVFRSGSHSALIRLLPPRDGDTRDVLLVEGGSGELTVAALRGLGLSVRESEALQRIALGEPQAAAAAAMGVARRTLDKHLQHVYAKLGVGSAAEASATAWAAVGVRPPGAGERKPR